MIRLALGLLVLVLAGPPLGPARLARAEEAPASASQPENLLAEFPTFSDGDLLLVPVTIAGRNYSFMVDTGFSTTTFDNRLAAALTLSPDRAGRVVRVIGAGTMEAATAREFVIAGLPPFRNWPAWRGDLSRIREATGHDIMGIIGIDVLRSFVVRIDADAGRLQFLKQPPESSETAMTIRWRKSGTPTIRAQLAKSVTDDLIVDTGNFSLEPMVDLASPLYQNLEQLGALKTLYAVASSRVDKFHDIRTGILDNLTLQDGPTLSKIRASEHPEGLNLLGLSALMQYNPVFDFPHERLLLNPRKQSVERIFPVQGSGLALLRRNGSTFVHSVRRNSRAFAAGMRTNDIVEFAAGKAATVYRLHELRLLVETTGPELKLGVRAPGGVLRSVMLSRQDEN